ncbi:MAG: tannase/feruloyl esterase family alpha/beta hydrolase [Rhodospirillaceae bacterium]|nr:tannase/feruloyl esterase family alpha/beta hydrolase [Rhodospirillaceae bacterium]
MNKLLMHALALLAAGTAAPAAAVDIKMCRALFPTGYDFSVVPDFSQVPDAPTHILEAEEIAAAGDVPAYCRVEGYVTPRVGFDLRMPTANWNGKMIMHGCGGYCGSLEGANSCADSLARGYACIFTDLGHRSTALDAKWAYNDAQALIDFYYRATHVTVQAGRAIVAAAYGQEISKSYFRGCSTGGRQGMISAQRFPADFDGIIAGAAASVSTAGGMHLIWSALANLDKSGAPIMSDAKVPMLAKAVMDKCDGLDGLVDGMIDDPRACGFDPAEIACKRGQKSDQCLTPAEVGVVRKIYAGAVNSKGENIYRAPPMPGSELTWVPVYIGENGLKGGYYYFGADYLRYIAYAEDPGPTWRPEDFDWDRDPPRLGYSRTFNNAANPDLNAFKERGGKLIGFQGWNDYSVPPTAIVDYYEKVVRLMGGLDRTQDFYRLFMLPGVNHCTGGVGPDRLDLLTALEAWVEQGQAPELVVAAKSTERLPGYPRFPLDASKITMTRPIYPYPAVARYAGSGDPNRAESFRRFDPPR